MNDNTLVERLRMTGKRISIPCPDGIDGCLVNHFRIETDPLCDEAATRIEALEAEKAQAAKAERDRIVAWLREHAKSPALGALESYRVLFVADALEGEQHVD